MGSLIGDYIHLTRQGYIKKMGAQKSPYYESFQSVLEERQRNFQAWLDSTDKNKNRRRAVKKELEKLLKLLNTAQTMTQAQIEDNEEISSLLNDIAQLLPREYLKVDLIAAAAKGELSGILQGDNAIKKGSNDATVIKKQIEKELNDYLDIAYESLKVGDLSTKNKEQLEGIISKVIGQMQVAGTEITNLEDTTEYFNKEIQEMKQKSKIPEQFFQKAIQLFSTLSKGFSGSSFVGQVGEALLVLAGRKATKVAVSSLQKGFEGSFRGLDSARFNVDFNKIEPYKFNKDGFLCQIDIRLQDKVDVEIQYKKKKDTFSVKAYSTNTLKQGLHGTASADLLQLFQNENDDDFINHYFNISFHKHHNTKDYKSTVLMLKRVVATKLIAGLNYQISIDGFKLDSVMDSADVLTVINNNDYSVNFFSMKDLFAKLEEKGKIQKIDIPVLTKKMNQEQNTYQQRITRIISPFAQKRVSITINQTLLNEVKRI